MRKPLSPVSRCGHANAAARVLGIAAIVTALFLVKGTVGQLLGERLFRYATQTLDVTEFRYENPSEADYRFYSFVTPFQYTKAVIAYRLSALLWDSPLPRLYLARILIDFGGRNDESLAIFRNLVARYPSDMQVRFAYAWYLVERFAQFSHSYLEEGREAFLLVLRNSRGGLLSARAMYMLGIINLAERQPLLARLYFNGYLARLPQAWQKTPYGWAAMNDLAYTYLISGRPDEAQRLYGEIERRDPTGRWRFISRMGFGLAAMARQDWQAAFAYFKEAEDLLPMFSDHDLGWDLHLTTKAQIDRARRSMRSLVYYNMSRAMAYMGDSEESERYLLAAKRESSFPQIHPLAPDFQ